MRHVVVGTAGHIDHGKSALIQALTGIDPDRLKEEKARGITIDLGFAHLALEDSEIGFVDVPGHERFVKNMLAGVGGIDLVMMVVAADESIMPQTREHFDICRLLGIQGGIVVITKVDLVEPELVELVREEIREAVRGSFLESAPVVAVSSKTGTGMEDLKRTLGAVARTVPGRPAGRVLRLPIDRCFSMRGFGTVVTGTLVAGRLRKDSEVELLPGNLIARVRGIQVHGRAAEDAVAGQRTAVNLQGVDLTQVRRGMVLTVPGRYRPTQVLDGRVTLLPGSPVLKNLVKARFHLGTSEVLARVALLGTDSLQPGQTAYAQLRLDAPVFCLHGDRFILRRFSPTVTIGGGRVLDPHPAKHRTTDKSLGTILRELDQAEYSRILPAMLVSRPGGATYLRELRSSLDLTDEEMHRLSAGLAEKRELVMVPGPAPVLASCALIKALKDETLAQVARFHEDHPLMKGMPREELRTRIYDRVPPEVFRYCLEKMADARQLSLQEETVALHGREVQLAAPELEMKNKIESLYLAARYQPPSLQDIQAQAGADQATALKIYYWMLKEKILVRISEDFCYHRDTLKEIKQKIRDSHPPGTRFGVAAFKELFGLTRKHAIPLLEHLDRERFTRREGNDRILQ